MQSTPPERLLIVLLGAIGDVVRALPLAQRLRAAWPDTQIAWAVEPPAAPILQEHPSLDQVIRFERPAGIAAFLLFLRAVRRSAPDLALDLQSHFKSGLTSWYSGAGVRIGFHRRNSREGNWLFNTEQITPVEEFSSKVQQFLRFADHLGVPAAPISFGLRLAADEWARVDSLLAGVDERFAVLWVGSTWPSRYWFPVPTALLCRGLRERGLRVVLIGGPADRSFAQAVLDAGAGEVINLVGHTSLRDVIGLLARATLGVGPDSGPMHIAAAVGTPVVSLWGATSPARSAPYGWGHLIVRADAPCAPCYLRRCPIGRLCMESITPEAVLARVDAALASRVSGVGCQVPVRDPARADHGPGDS